MLRRLILMTALLSFTTSAPAGEFDLTWNTIDGGGGTSAGGAFTLSGTIGQPDAQVSPVMSGGSFQLTGGFWSAETGCNCPGDMNGDGLRNGGDVQKFVSCVIAGGNCSCADVDQANGVDLADVPVFVNALLSGANCSQ
jgi:hypothetical protein